MLSINIRLHKDVRLHERQCRKGTMTFNTSVGQLVCSLAPTRGLKLKAVDKDHVLTSVLRAACHRKHLLPPPIHPPPVNGPSRLD